MDKNTEKALFIIAAINTVLVYGAIAVGVIAGFKLELDLKIYVPVLAVCALLITASNVSLWVQYFKSRKKQR